ncbi:MAG TPA: polyphosphate kinase 2 family protein [Burkholderiales bacterium]|nr:polyphosphate kinase 2 family protein [Burkholderiales bacterium]
MPEPRMAHRSSRKSLGKLAAPYRVGDGAKFRLERVDPGDTGELESEGKADAQQLLARGVERLARLQEKLAAQAQWSLLLVFQAMDAAGKDGAIKHVMSGVNPQGCRVVSFKAPSREELAHDWLWRCVRVLPERGQIGIFNRSYYEEVLAVRVHRDLLETQNLPGRLVTGKVWDQRYQDIRGFERHLARSGTVIRKFFLHVSKKEQKKRLLERLDDPEKHWKFSENDARQRASWADYMSAYEDMVRETASESAPWFVVPADRKWYTRLVVAAAIVDALEELDLAFPEMPAGKKRALARARHELMSEKS